MGDRMSKKPDVAGARAREPKLSDFRPATRNANRHTERGIGLLDQAMARDGYVAPITVAADGEALDGSARLERAFERFPDAEPIVVEHDGTRPVVMVRTDIPHAQTVQAHRIALAANRIAQVDLEWDGAMLEELAGEMPELDLGALGFDGDFSGAAEEPEPPGEFAEKDENLETEHTCPKCGYAWSGGK